VAVRGLACARDGTAWVVAHENGRKAGNDAPGGQFRHALGQLGADGGRRGLAVKDDRGHRIILAGPRESGEPRPAPAQPSSAGCQAVPAMITDTNRQYRIKVSMIKARLAPSVPEVADGGEIQGHAGRLSGSDDLVVAD